MARHRKRRSDRRPDRAGGQASARPGLATANGPWRGEEPTDQAPDPIEHAAPDVELAEAQLAVGRGAPDEDEAPLSEEELVAAEEAEAAEAAGAGNGRGGNGRGSSRRLGGGGSGDAGPGGAGGGGAGGTAVSPGAQVTRAPAGSRVVHFVQGSWRELQRVQWPDRRQVIQATGVVIGFVIVAGVFLGVADFVAQKIVNLLLK